MNRQDACCNGGGAVVMGGEGRETTKRVIPEKGNTRELQYKNDETIDAKSNT